MFINLQDLYDNLKKEFQPLFSNGTDVKSINEAEKSTATTTSTTQSEPSPYNPDPLRVTRPDRQPVFPDNYGRNDLDPFGRFDPLSRGGMIFDPFRDPNRNRYIPGNLPPGSVPPQARFDPFGPPNPDDLRPGYPGRIG